MLTSIHGRWAMSTAVAAWGLAIAVGQAALGDEPLPPTYAGLGAAAVKLREFVIPRGWPTPSCHASTIVETAPGELVAAWFGGTDEGEKDVAIWVARHDSAGWSEPRIAIEGTQADGSRHPCWNPVLFVGSSRAAEEIPPPPSSSTPRWGPHRAPGGAWPARAPMAAAPGGICGASTAMRWGL